jgi:hypothetical protein
MARGEATATDERQEKATGGRQVADGLRLLAKGNR